MVVTAILVLFIGSARGVDALTECSGIPIDQGILLATMVVTFVVWVVLMLGMEQFTTFINDNEDAIHPDECSITIGIFATIFLAYPFIHNWGAVYTSVYPIPLFGMINWGVWIGSVAGISLLSLDNYYATRSGLCENEHR